MAQDEVRKEDLFEFQSEGEVLGYISRDQARVSAMMHARDNPVLYGPKFQDRVMAFNVVASEESEDYYDISLSYRPSGRFTGEPGLLQFIIEKIQP